jgi:hypothetical protein
MSFSLFSDSQSTDITYISDSTIESFSTDSENELLFLSKKRCRKNSTDDSLFLIKKKNSDLYLEREFNIYSLIHQKIETINSDKNKNIGLLCSIRDDRLQILIQNIINWIEKDFNCYLFFSESSEYYEIIEFIDLIKENKIIVNNFNKIKYVTYSYSSKMMEDSAGSARVSAIIFFNIFFMKNNKKSFFVISDDRRLTNFSNINKMFNEIVDNQILFPQSQRSKSMKNRKTFGKKLSKKNTTYSPNKLGQVYIMNSKTIEKICNNKKILECMSAPIFEDYILLYLDINIKISKYCNRYNYGKQESIARKIISIEGINTLLSTNNSKGYFLNIVLDIITKHDIKIYSTEGYTLHKKILDIYLQ